ncbi:hypothetical protein GQ600_12800 [Phytophthora cactorum]|nr:hypothetical protein GQ600_12800 [Phytophthora cactorum]
MVAAHRFLVATCEPAGKFRSEVSRGVEIELPLGIPDGVRMAADPGIWRSNQLAFSMLQTASAVGGVREAYDKKIALLVFVIVLECNHGCMRALVCSRPRGRLHLSLLRTGSDKLTRWAAYIKYGVYTKHIGSYLPLAVQVRLDHALSVLCLPETRLRGAARIRGLLDMFLPCFIGCEQRKLQAVPIATAATIRSNMYDLHLSSSLD